MLQQALIFISNNTKKATYINSVTGKREDLFVTHFTATISKFGEKICGKDPKFNIPHNVGFPFYQLFLLIVKFYFF